MRMTRVLVLLLAACGAGDGSGGDGGGGQPDLAEPACTGVGFAGAASAWALPSGFPTLTFDRTADLPSCAAPDAVSFSTFDLNGDSRPALVLTICRASRMYRSASSYVAE